MYHYVSHLLALEISLTNNTKYNSYIFISYVTKLFLSKSFFIKENMINADKTKM